MGSSGTTGVPTVSPFCDPVKGGLLTFVSQSIPISSLDVSRNRRLKPTAQNDTFWTVEHVRPGFNVEVGTQDDRKVFTLLYHPGNPGSYRDRNKYLRRRVCLRDTGQVLCDKRGWYINRKKIHRITQSRKGSAETTHLTERRRTQRPSNSEDRKSNHLEGLL